MNREPVTLEQLMLAASVLAAFPQYKDCEPSGSTLLKRAYGFVRGCQEQLPKLAEAERQRDEKMAGKPELFPDGKSIPFKKAAELITGRSERRAIATFEKFLRQDQDYGAAILRYMDVGIPEKIMPQLKKKFLLWDKHGHLVGKVTRKKTEKKAWDSLSEKSDSPK
jgi:hypothetical protein